MPDELNAYLREVASIDGSVCTDAQERLNSLTKPPGSLGMLEDVVVQVCGITGSMYPELTKRTVYVMAGDHGITTAGVSAYPREVTVQMVGNFLNNGAGINALGHLAGFDVKVVDMGVNADLPEGHPAFISRKVAPGTANFLTEDAMSRDQAARAVVHGIELLTGLADDELPHLVATGEMGIGNTTAATAITAVFTGKPVQDITGYGTGISEDVHTRKVKTIEDALAARNAARDDPLGVLAKVGGFEIAGITGLIIGAAIKRIPVIVDGFISQAGALVAYGLHPATRDYMLFGHQSQEPGSRAAIAHMHGRALLDLGMRLGEGTGAVLAAHLVDGAFACYRNMATFEEAAVAGKKDDD